MITVLMPTRGRPEAAREAAESFLDTRSSLTETWLVAVLDAGDPQLGAYRDALPGEVEQYVTVGNMIQRTNNAARHVLASDRAIWAVGWMADDNRFRTDDWDVEVESWVHVETTGYIALNDKFWSERQKAVNVFVRRQIIEALGWYANPGQQHHYMDDTWRVLGISTDSYVYLPEIVCEHLHPILGKTEWDKEYRDHETREFYAREDRAFIDWVQQRFTEDRATVLRALRG